MHPLDKICWLAFCSGSFLKREGRHIPLPSGLWKEYFHADEFPDHTTTFNDGLGLPQSVTQYAKTNQTVLQYQVHQSTNLFGWNFPLQFFLVQYLPDRTNGWVAHLTAKGRVTAIGAGSKPEMPADVYKYMNVSDVYGK